MGQNIFTLYFTLTTNAKSKKGHNLAKILRIITNIEPDLYFMIYPSANLQTFKGVVGSGNGVVYLTSLGRPPEIGLQLGKACYPCSR